MAPGQAVIRAAAGFAMDFERNIQEPAAFPGVQRIAPRFDPPWQSRLLPAMWTAYSLCVRPLAL
jgi:hypothetical protein